MNRSNNNDDDDDDNNTNTNLLKLVDITLAIFILYEAINGYTLENIIENKAVMNLRKNTSGNS